MTVMVFLNIFFMSTDKSC